MLFTQKCQSALHIHLASPRCPPLQDARGEGKRHHMHLKQQNQAKCHYMHWNPAKTLFSCPLGLAQQLSK